jgi:hypothetical protein
MNFVNPLFWLGALAAGIPILLHLIKRERALRIEFPTLMFLRRVSRKTIRYQKLRHLLLLLMRILACLFLVLAFLRPYRDIPRAAASSGRVSVAHILLLDNSLSMGYGDRWDRARKAAAEIARGVQRGDRVSLLEFSDQTLVRVPPTVESSAVVEEIEREVQLTDRPTRYAQALKMAEKIALDAGTGRRIIHLISDFQKSGWAADEQEFRLGSSTELERIDVGSDKFSNLTIGDVRVIEVAEGAEGSLRLKFALVNFGTEDRKSVRLSLSLDGRGALEKRTDIGTGEVQAEEFQLPGLTAGAHQVVIEVEDSRLARDNRYSMVLETRGRTQVLAVEDPAPGPGARPASYFLSRALNVPVLSRYQLISVPPARLDSSGVPSGSLVIWNNASGASTGVQKKLQDFVSGGGGLVVVVADGGRAAEFNRTFATWLPVKADVPSGAERGAGWRGEDYVLLTDLRMDHPVFRPFSEPHSGSFSAARFYRHAKLVLSEGADALAHFDNGDPALVSVARDKGRIVIFASSADDSANDLPLKAVYAPFWQQTLRFLDNVSEESHSVEIGSIVSPRKYLLETALRQGRGGLDSGQAIVVLDPSRQRVPIPAGSDSVIMDRVGFYEVRTANQSTSIAVNPVPRESDLTHGNSEEMAAGWVSPDAAAPPVVAEDERPLPEEQDQRQRFWRYLLIAALAFFAGEALLANQFILKPD